MAVDFETVSVAAVITAGNTSITLTEGVDYTLPSGPTDGWFAMLSSNHATGMGNIASGGTQNANDVTAWISSQTASSIIITREGTTGSSRVDFQIIAYIGAVSGNNEIIVREVGVVAVPQFSTSGVTSAITSIVNDADVVPFRTGQGTANGTTDNYQLAMFQLTLASNIITATRTRDDSLSTSSYAAVEFTGSNWTVNNESYNLSQVPLTLGVTVSDLTKTFLHIQFRNTNVSASQGLDDISYRTWLASTTTLDGAATTADAPTEKTYLTYIVENSASGTETMVVNRVVGTTMTGGTEEQVMDLAITTLTQLNNASLMGLSADSTGAGNAFPRGYLSFALTTDSNLQIKQSDNGQTTLFDFEVVSWPETDAVGGGRIMSSMAGHGGLAYKGGIAGIGGGLAG